MKLEHQVTSLEISKRLKELGVKQESYFWWEEYNKGYVVLDRRISEATAISAFTVAELAVRARGITYGTYEDGIHYAKINMEFYSDRRWSQEDTALETIQDENEANVRGKLRIYLLENKLITPHP